MNIIFRQTSNNVMDPSPWPVVLGEDERGGVEIISGRPDAHTLIGFAESADSAIKVTASNLLDESEKLESILGLLPVFVDRVTQGFFCDSRPVSSASEYTAEPARLDYLRAKEAEYVEAFMSVERARLGQAE